MATLHGQWSWMHGKEPGLFRQVAKIIVSNQPSWVDLNFPLVCLVSSCSFFRHYLLWEVFPVLASPTNCQAALFWDPTIVLNHIKLSFGMFLNRWMTFLGAGPNFSPLYLQYLVLCLVCNWDSIIFASKENKTGSWDNEFQVKQTLITIPGAKCKHVFTF